MSNTDTPNLILMSFRQKTQIRRRLNFMQYGNREYILNNDKLEIGYFENNFWHISRRFKVEKMDNYFNLIIDDRFKL